MKFTVAVLALLLLITISFSAWAVNDLRSQVHELEGKVVALADRPQAPPVVAPSSSSASHPAGASSSTPNPGGTDSVHSEKPAGSASGEPAGDGAVARKPETGSTPPVGSTVNPDGWTEADRTAFEKEVLAVLDKREKDREARQDARQAEWMTSRLKDQLKLTDQQAQEVGKIVATTMADIEKIRSSMTPENRDEIRPQIQATLQAADTQVKALLTAEQVTAYDDLKKNGGGLGFGGGGFGGGGRRRGGPGGGGGEQQ